MLLESLVVFVLVIAAFAIPAPASEPTNDSANVPHNARVVVLIARSFPPSTCAVTIHARLCRFATCKRSATESVCGEIWGGALGGLVPGASPVAHAGAACPPCPAGPTGAGFHAAGKNGGRRVLPPCGETRCWDRPLRTATRGTGS